MHGSLLPRWRGAAPIQRAIWAGDAQTGITIMQMDEGLDTGAMLYKVYCDIAIDETSASLYDKLATLAPDALLEVLDNLENGKFVAKPQDNAQSTYADKLSKDEAKLDWKVYRATVLPHVQKTAGTVLQADKNGIQIATTDGVLNLLELQPAGKKPMSAQDLLNGRADWFSVGKQL